MSTTNTTTATTDLVTQNIVVFVPNVTTWSGRKRLKRTDFRIPDSDLPPTDIASFGSKKVCNSKAIAFQERFKKQFIRMLEDRGVRFLGGFAIPEAMVTDTSVEADAIRSEYLVERQDFLNGFQDEIDTWQSQHPDWAEMLKEAVPAQEYVAGRMHFGWSAFRIQPASADDDSLNQGLHDEVSGLSGQLFKEVAQAAYEWKTRSLAGRTEATRKVLSPLKTIRSKLDGLSFLDHRVLPLIQSIDHVFATLPPGKIEDMGMHTLRGIASILSDVDEMIEHGEAVLAGGPVGFGVGFQLPPSTVDTDENVSAEVETESVGEVAAEVDSASVDSASDILDVEVVVDAIAPSTIVTPYAVPTSVDIAVCF